MTNALRRGAVANAARSIGGVAIGTAGTGNYLGYSMMGGDDMTTLNIVKNNNPLGRYFTTHYYDPGARYNSGQLINGYDLDPYFTGAQDSNYGVALGAGNMSQSSSVFNLQAVEASGSEIGNINGCTVATCMLHTAGYITASPPFIVEARMKFTPKASNPAGWHTDFALAGLLPIVTVSVTPPAPGAVDFNFEGNSQALYLISNIYGATSGLTAQGSSAPQDIFDGNFHKLTYIVDTTGVYWYIDDVLKSSILEDATNTNKPFHIYFTCHTFNGSFQGESFNSAAWAASASGATMSVDWYRIWIPNSTAPIIFTPQQSLPTMQVDYNTNIIYTVPSTISLWGAGFSGSEFFECIKNEDLEPGSVGEGLGDYTRFPDGMSYNSGTRVFSGKPTTSPNPGRLHVRCIAYQPGAMSYVARGYIDIGPTVTTPTQNLVNGVPYSHNIYSECNCGFLIPKIISVGTLPNGLNYNPTTYIISGTSTINGTVVVPITVTNANGQTSTVNINFVTAVQQALVIDGTPVTNNNVSTTTVTATLTTTKTNDMICIIFPLASGITLSSISSTSGLTFTKRTETGLLTGGGNWQFYTAPSALALTSEVITVTYGSSTSTRIVAFAVAGVGNTASPFDTNVSVPAAKVDNLNHTTISEVISTDYTNDLTFAFMNTINDHSAGFTPPSGWTNMLTINNFYAIYYKVQTGALSSQTVAYSWTNPSPSDIIVDAFKGF